MRNNSPSSIRCFELYFVWLKRIPKGKARGPDGIPGGLCHHQAAQLLKVCVHGHEPLEYKGGRLTAAYKGRGPSDECSSYRSLLISNHLGKAIHRALRMKCAPLYEKFLQAQQTGGRRKIPVQLPLHQARAFVRHARETGVLTHTPHVLSQKLVTQLSHGFLYFFKMYTYPAF